MGLQDKITKIDALNLKSIQKKLKLSLIDRVRALGVQNDPDLSEDEKIRKFLNIPDEMTTTDYLHSKLNQSEIDTANKFLKNGLL